MNLDLDRRQALEVWRNVTVQTVRRDEPDLTARQTAILMTVYLTPPPHTVRGLAASLNIGKPAVTRALDTLVRLGLVKRKRDEEDGRNVLVQRTVKGSVYLSDLGDLIVNRTGAAQR
jgi:DNA-binding MarR family transcriptional regulator